MTEHNQKQDNYREIKTQWDQTISKSRLVQLRIMGCKNENCENGKSLTKCILFWGTQN